MNDRIAVGTPVTVTNRYGEHEGRNDLVILTDRGTGYGVGPKYNDPARHHNGEKGWLYYSDYQVAPKKESKTVTEFNKGDKVEVFQNGYTSAGWVGVKGIVKEVRYNSGYRVELTDPAKSGEKVGYVAYLTGDNLKLIEEPVLTLDGFAVGDKVRYKSTLWTNLEGVVSAINGDLLDVRVTKLPDNNTRWSSLKLGKTLVEQYGGLGICPKDLTKIEEPKPFTFKDIQKGDTIRRTATYKGATEVREGVVGTKGSYCWATEQGNYILAYDTDGTTSITDVTLELLNRPKPEPTLLENTKIGDKLVIRYTSGSTKVYTKARHGGECWDTLVIHANGKVGKGAQWSNTELEEFAASEGNTTTLIPA